MNKDLESRKIKRKYLTCLIGILILVFLLVIKPGVTIDNNIIKIYYIISFVGLILVGSIFPLVSDFIEDDKHAKFWNNIVYNISDILSLFIILCCVCQSIFAFGWFKAEVNGKSMLDTLNEKDVLIIRSSNNKLENFDIIIIELNESNRYVYETKNKELLVKRLIGQGGDEIELIYDAYYLNGEKIGSILQYDIYREIGNGIEIIDDHFYISEGYYFAMGDNRNHSSDSRYFGLFTKKQIMGKAIYRVNSLFDWERVGAKEDMKKHE